MRDTHTWRRKHVAEVNGDRVRFKSYYRLGTFGLHSDAVQALKNAGIYECKSDWDLLKIDGRPHTY